MTEPDSKVENSTVTKGGSESEAPKSSKLDVYFVRIELEAIDDWKLEEIEKRFLDKERQEKAKSYVSVLKTRKEIYISQIGKFWSISAIGDCDSHGLFTYLQQLTMDVFDKKFVTLVTKSNIGGYIEDIIN